MSNDVTVYEHAFPVLLDNTRFLPVSIYTYYGDRSFKKTVKHEKGDIEIKGIESAIISAVHQHGLLSKVMVRNKIVDILPEKMRRRNYDTYIDNLAKNGYLSMYAYDDNINSGIMSPVLYGPTEKSLNYKPLEENSHIPYIKEKETMPTTDALELAELNQWHICVSHQYRRMVKGEVYHKKITFSNEKTFIIDSILHFSSKLLVTPTVTIAALPFPKMLYSEYKFNKSAVSDKKAEFLNKLISLNTFFRQQQKRYPYAMIVLLVENYDAIEDAFNLISSYDNLKSIPIYFCTDSESRREDVLTSLIKTSEGLNEQNIKKLSITSLNLFK